VQPADEATQISELWERLYAAITYGVARRFSPRFQDSIFKTRGCGLKHRATSNSEIAA